MLAANQPSFSFFPILLAWLLSLVWAPLGGGLKGATLPAGTNAAARCHLRLQYPVEGAQFPIGLSSRTIYLTQPVTIQAGLEGRAFQADRFCFEWRRANAIADWREIGKDEEWNKTFISWLPTTPGKYHVRAWARTMGGWIVSQTETLEVLLPEVSLVGVPEKALVGDTILLSVLMKSVEMAVKNYRFQIRTEEGGWATILEGGAATATWQPMVPGRYDVRVVGSVGTWGVYSPPQRVKVSLPKVEMVIIGVFTVGDAVKVKARVLPPGSHVQSYCFEGWDGKKWQTLQKGPSETIEFMALNEGSLTLRAGAMVSGRMYYSPEKVASLSWPKWRQRIKEWSKEVISSTLPIGGGPMLRKLHKLIAAEGEKMEPSERRLWMLLVVDGLRRLDVGAGLVDYVWNIWSDGEIIYDRAKDDGDGTLWAALQTSPYVVSGGTFLPSVGLVEGIYGVDLVQGVPLTTGQRWLRFGEVLVVVAGPVAFEGRTAVRSATQTLKRLFSKTPKAGAVRVRPHGELVKDFTQTPQNWERIKSQAIQTTKKGQKGGVSIESVWRNKQTGEMLYTHEAFGPSGKSLHPENRSPNLLEGGVIRPYSKIDP